MLMVDRHDHAMGSRALLAAVTLVVGGVLVGCGGGAPEPAPEPAAAPSAAESTSAPPRVFFIAPQDETDHSDQFPLAFEFGVENFEISAVPDPVGSVRPGVGHYHLGLNAECLPAGEVIPEGAPWIHFGDGSNSMEMMLEQGHYRFTVQIGDDEHRTLEGLCETITIRMEVDL